MVAVTQNSAGDRSRWRGVLFAVLCLTGIAWLIYHCFPDFHYYATTSLWTDEIYSIHDFSGRGPLYCLLDWHTPNNHMLFNALNTVVMGGATMDPFRARLLTFICVGLTLVIGVFYFGKRGHWLAALLFGWVLIGDNPMFSITLTARGYGMLGLFALLVCILVARCVTTKRHRLLIPLGASVVLGTWTLPPFVFFGGTALLLLFLLRRDWRTLVTGGVSLAAILMIYVPSYLRFWRTASPDTALTVGDFFHLDAPLRMVAMFVPGGNGDSITAVSILSFSALIGLPLLLWWLVNKSSEKHSGESFASACSKQAEALALSLLSLASLGAFGLALIVKGILFRNLAFMLIPMTFVIGDSLSFILEDFQGKAGITLRFAMATLFLGLIVLQTGLHEARRPKFPREAWRNTAAVIESLDLNTKTFFHTGRSEYLDYHLHGPPLTSTDTFDQEAFLAGDLVVTDCGPIPESGIRFEGQKLTGRAIDITLPQLRWDFQRVSFVPPDSKGVASLTVKQKPGTTSQRTFLIDVKLERTANWKKLFVYSPEDDPRKPPKVKWIPASSDHPVQLTEQNVHYVSGQLWEIDLTNGKLDPEAYVTELVVSYYTLVPLPNGPDLMVWCSEESALP